MNNLFYAEEVVGRLATLTRCFLNTEFYENFSKIKESNFKVYTRTVETNNPEILAPLIDRFNCAGVAVSTIYRF